MRRRILYLYLFLLSSLRGEVYNEVVIESQSAAFDWSTQTIQGKGVTLRYLDGSTLEAEEAEIDNEKKMGIFSGGKELPFVIFTSNLETPFTLTSRKMLATWGENGGKNIFEATPKGEVAIEVQDEYRALGDFAQFTCSIEKKKEPAHSLKKGELSLHSLDSSHPCQVLDDKGNHINASHIYLNLESGVIHCKSVQGTNKNEKEETRFYSQNLLWGKDHRQLQLEGDVLIDSPQFGVFTCSDSITIDQNKRKEIEKILSTGKAVYYHTVDQKIEHTLSCDGSISFDKKASALHLKRGNSEQISFFDDLGIIQADQATVFFTMDNNRYTPHQVAMEGNITIQNILSQLFGTDKIIEQYAVADYLVYYPQVKKLVLQAKKKKRVLFYDHTHGIQISAPEMSMTRGSSDYPEAYGKGNVRLQFTDKELGVLKKAFTQIQL